MKILIVSSCFYPNRSPRSFRTTELAKEFSRIGHDITVVARFEDYDFSTFLTEHPMKLIPLQASLLADYLKTTIRKCGKFVSRFLNRLLYQFFDFPEIMLINEIAKALRTLEPHDLVISIAAPHAVHWGVNGSRKRNRGLARIWIADCGDPFMLAKLEPFKRPFYFAVLEKRFCNACNFITVPFAGAKEGYYSEYRSKIRVIPQGFNFEGIKLASKLNGNSNPTFAYAGGLALKGVRSPIVFLEWLRDQDFDFEFHIYSPNIDIIPNRLLQDLTGKLFLHQSIPRENLLYELSRFHFLVNFDNDSSCQLPSKLIDYAFTGRPILNIKPSALDVDMIREFLNANYQKALVIETLNDFDIRNVAKSFLSLTDEIR